MISCKRWKNNVYSISLGVFIKQNTALNASRGRTQPLKSGDLGYGGNFVRSKHLLDLPNPPPPEVMILLHFWENLEDYLFQKCGGPNPPPHSPLGYITEYKNARYHKVPKESTLAQHTFYVKLSNEALYCNGLKP